MTSSEIEAVYSELEKMFVELKPEPELGLEYVRERLVLCRAMQDRLQELRLKVNRAQSRVFEEKVVAMNTHAIDPERVTKKDISDLDVSLQRHVMLGRMISMQAQILSRTAMDIRLLADLTKEYLKREAVNPNEVPGLIKQASVQDLAMGKEVKTPDLTVPDFGENTSEPPQTTSALPLTGTVVTGYEPMIPWKYTGPSLTGLTAHPPFPGTEPARMPLPEHESKTVTLDELLESVNGGAARIF